MSDMNIKAEVSRGMRETSESREVVGEHVSVEHVTCAMNTHDMLKT